MINISQYSWQVLKTQEERKYEDTRVAYIVHFFPHRAQSMDEAALRKCVQSVDERACKLGLIGRRDRLLFLTLCARYGWDFEEREENTWVRKMLHNVAVTDPSARLRHLERMLERTSGDRR